MKTLIFDLDGTLVQLKPTLICLANKKKLAALRTKYNFALASGSPRDEVVWALAETGLETLFDWRYVVTVEDTNSQKASGKPFQEIKKRLSGKMVMIGDSDADEKGAKIAGLPFIRVASGTETEKQRTALTIAINEAINALT